VCQDARVVVSPVSPVARARIRRAVVASLALAVASCGVRAPSRIDVDAMIRARGADEARRDLVARIANSPKDIAARLALAALEEQTGRPGPAIAELEAVAALGGPIGTRWRDEDRARLGRLLAARGRVRVARGASTAIADFARAAELGTAIDPKDLTAARVLRALAQLRHVDRKERAAGMRVLAELWTTGGADPAWAGARSAATPIERGQLGRYLWQQGANRAAWEELAGWHAATTPPRDPALAAAYLTARAWWVPADGPPPSADDLVGPDRCRFTQADGCSASELMKREPLDEAALAALLASPAVVDPARADAATVTAWMQVTLLQALRGETSWGPALMSRVDVSKVPTNSMPGPFRAAFSILAGREPVAEAGALGDLVGKRGYPVTEVERLLFAAGRVLRGATDADVAKALGVDEANRPGARPAVASDRRATWAEGAWLLRVVSVPAEAIARPLVSAAVAHARQRVPHGLDELALRRIVEAYLRDPAIADRLGRDGIAALPDAATGHASLGAVLDALGDPARARLAWQAAVDASPEVDHLRGLAEAIARAKDPDAAMVATVAAAAAWGDPAIVWISVARSLEQTGEHVHALEAARNAIGLASSTRLVEAIDVAISASRSLRRETQVAELTAMRARIAPPMPERPTGMAEAVRPTGTAEAVRPIDPTDAIAALVEYTQQPDAGSVARLWVAARWNRRHVGVRAALLAAISPDDPRHGVVVAELVALASDREVGRDAVAALRTTR
jgi:tetratricopeptide (TPR) repeat protein